MGSALFSVYVSNFSSYNETYGSLGGIIVAMLWLVLTAVVVLLGAELASEMERQPRYDPPEVRDEPPGPRSPPAAHTLGPPASSVPAPPPRHPAPPTPPPG